MGHVKLCVIDCDSTQIQRFLQGCIKGFPVTTDIYGRSQTYNTAPCNGVVSHGAQF